MDISSLLSLLLKGVGLAVFGLGIATLMGRRSAAARHLVGALSLTGLILLPLLSLSLPVWRVALPTRPIPEFAVPQTAPMSPTAAAPAEAVKTAEAAIPAIPAPARPTIALPRKDAIALPAAAPAIPTAPAPAASSAAALLTLWPFLVLFAYLSGLLVAAIAILRDQVAAWLLVRSCSPLSADLPAATLADAVRRLEVRRPIALLYGESITVPMTAGWLRPVILLPRDAQHWEAEELRVALLHETAHILRSDFAWQFVGRVACALHWCNPLAWLLARRMREEAERACDDRVLAAGVAASDYADRLLHVASGLARLRPPVAAAVPMARQSDLGRRLDALLSAHADRSALSPARASLLTATIAAVLLPIAAVRARQETPVAETEAVVKTSPATLVPTRAVAAVRVPSFRHTLEDGTVVELVAVAPIKRQGFVRSSEPSSWWKPDGTPGIGPLPYRQETYDANTRYGKDECEFLVRVTGPGASRDSGRTFQSITPSSRSGLTGGMLPSGRYSPELSVVSFAPPPGTTTVTFRLGVAPAKWQRSTVDTPVALASSTSGTTAAGRSVGEVIFGRPVVTRLDPYNAGNPPQLGTFQHVSYTPLRDEEIRWVADTLTSRTVPAMSPGGISGSDPVSEELFFPGLRTEQITHIRMESRPYEWVTFQNVALKPVQTTSSAPAAASTSATIQHFAPGSVEFPNGVVAQGFYVEGIEPDGSMAAWDKDGRLLSRAPYRPEFHLKTGDIRLNIEHLGLSGLPETLDETTYKRLRSNYEIESEFGMVGETLMRATGPGASQQANGLFSFTETIVWHPAPGIRRADAYLTTGYGPWQTLGTSDRDMGSQMAVPGGGIVQLSPLQTKRRGVETEIVATVPTRFVATDENGRPLWRLRLEPVDAEGKALRLTRFAGYDESSSDVGTGRLRFRFLTSDLPFAKVKSVRLLARPLQTVYFRDVPTRPKNG